MKIVLILFILALATQNSYAAIDATEALTSTKFLKASSTTDTKLFSQLDAGSTGLEVNNQYDDPKMWGKRYREFMGGGMGSGVAAGDFDNDGKVDLYVSTKTKPGRLFRNLGGWKFEDVTDDAGLSESGSILGWLSKAVSEEVAIWRQGSVFADVNNDGWLDLYVSRNKAPNLLYINQRDGTFKEEGEKRGLGIIDGSVVGAFADYDRDGWLDVLVLTNQVDGTEPGGRQDRLFRNRGDGTFTETTRSAGLKGASFGHAATWFDFNEDQWPDFYVANDFSGVDYLYLNNTDGTFTNVINEVAPHTPYSSMGADATDLNNDGHFDLLVADMATTSREKDRRGLAAARGDVLTTGTTKGIVPQYTRNTLLLNTGLGSFGEAACWAGIHATDWTWSVRFEDFDNDGWTDLHVTNGMVREANNSDLLARMLRSLSDLQRIAVIKRAPPLEETNLAYRNLSGNGFEEVTEAWGLTDIGVTFGAATADLDKDGDLDLAYLDYNGGLKVFRNNATNRNSIQIRLQGTNSNHFGVGAIVRVESKSAGLQSRTLTVSRGYASGSELVAHFGLGQDEKIDRLIVEWPSGAEQIFTNLETNFAYLIKESGTVDTRSPSNRELLFNSNAGSYGLEIEDQSKLAIPDKEQAFLPFRTDRAGPSLAIGDLNGDGLEDIFLGATSGSPHRLLIHKDGKYIVNLIDAIPSSGVEHGPALVFDADGDGHKDLLVTHASADASAWPEAFQPQLYTNQAAGDFTATNALPKMSINTGAAIAADIDSDGDIDLFLGGRSIPGQYPNIPRSFILTNEYGTFSDKTNELCPELSEAGLVKSALFRDIDRDGYPDLIIALEWDFVRYFHNEGNGRFSDQTKEAGFESGGKGWWNGMASADFNGDGQLDFAIGNLGLNTTYNASSQEPVTLFYGDFAQNGTRLLAEAVYDKGELFPVRSQVDIGTKLPSVLRKFPQNDTFAKANMSDVYGGGPLKAARRLEASNLHSGIFLSQPSGQYRFVEMPPEAQIGPIQGILAADLDGDGHIDIAATQNTDIAIPRFHGGAGLFLKGNGDGSFKLARPDETGIALTGNGRAIVLLDPNNDYKPDLFATHHGGNSVLLSNNSKTERWVVIQLQGDALNPDAIGAQIELAFSDGSTQYEELGLGGGWHSQAAAKIYLSKPSNCELRLMKITWPDGSESEHRDIPESGIWRILKPTMH